MAEFKTYRGRIYKPQTLEEFFWSHVDRRGPDECWDWNASRFPNGYGRIHRNGRHLLAHRVSWELNVGPIPEGLLVLHRCDRRECQNYERHLFLGTTLDNILDKIAKKRDAPSQPGYRSPLAGKLYDVCRKGHPMTEDNIKYLPRNTRQCKTCFLAASKLRTARYRMRKKERLLMQQPLNG